MYTGDRIGLESFLKKHSGKYYVYELCRPDGTVFYVGKGLNRRVFEHELEAARHHPIGESNPFKCNVIRQIISSGNKIGYRIDSVYEPSCQKTCLERETYLIQTYKRRHEGGTLTNLAAGNGSASGSSPYSIAKHAATLSGMPDNNPERATLNRFLQGIGTVASVPIKPMKQLSRILPTTPHPMARTPTIRAAYALLASASAHGRQVRPQVQIPRSFAYENVFGIIENGVARDILKSGMASLRSAPDPRNEVFELDDRQCGIIYDLVGKKTIYDLGLL